MSVLVLNVIHYCRHVRIDLHKHMNRHERQQCVHSHCNSINVTSCSRVVHYNFFHVIVFETIMRVSFFKQHDYQECRRSYYCVHKTTCYDRFKHHRHRSQVNEHSKHCICTSTKETVDSKKLNFLLFILPF